MPTLAGKDRKKPSHAKKYEILSKHSGKIRAVIAVSIIILLLLIIPLNR